MPAPMILVVEDSPLNARLLRALLIRGGLEVTLAVDAEAALDVLGSLIPDLILMDMQLPGMSGRELTRLLKADPARCGIPIIALTVNNSSADRQMMMEAGCDGYITKPVNPADFAAEIMSFIPAGQRPLAGEKYVPVPASNGEYTEEDQILLLKQKFLSQGVEESAELLARSADSIDQILHRWIGCGYSAGIPEISVRARIARDLISRRATDLAALTNEAHALTRLFAEALAAFPDT